MAKARCLLQGKAHDECEALDQDPLPQNKNTAQSASAFIMEICCPAPFGSQKKAARARLLPLTSGAHSVPGPGAGGYSV